MEEIERSAASVEEAIEAALGELGLSEQEARIEIVQEPRSGFLGLSSQPAVVRVRPLDVAGPEGGLEEQEDAAVQYVTGLVEVLGLEADVDLGSDQGVSYVEIWPGEGSEDGGVLIGRRGHTLDAIQELLRAYVQRETGARCQVMVDVEDYRKRQRSRIMRQAQEVARRVRKSGRAEALEPMKSYERKIVHDVVGSMGGLETSSEGEDPERRVVIRKVR